jgi:hypothetical protein
MPGDSIYSGTAKKLIFELVIILQDSAEDLNIGRRMLRYGRVLEDLCNRSFNKIMPYAMFKIQSLVPILMTAVNSNDPYRAVGVTIESTLA